MKIYLDIDGVLADFSNYFIEFYNEIQDKTLPVTEWGDDRIKKYLHLAKNDRKFWLSIPSLVSPDDITFNISGYCTARNPELYDVTKEWLKLNGFPTAPLFCVISGKEEVLLGNNVDIFLDDAPHNFMELNRLGIKTYLMDKPYNQHIRTELRVRDMQEFGKRVKNETKVS